MLQWRTYLQIISGVSTNHVPRQVTVKGQGRSCPKYTWMQISRNPLTTKAPFSCRIIWSRNRNSRWKPVDGLHPLNVFFLLVVYIVIFIWFASSVIFRFIQFSFLEIKAFSFLFISSSFRSFFSNFCSRKQSIKFRSLHKTLEQALADCTLASS